MEGPYEGVITTAIEKIADGVIAKMNLNEEKRNREFTYQLKELEFYKSNYEKDLKSIFDYWFELVRVVHIKDNVHLTENEKKTYEKKYHELIAVEKTSKMKMNTLKYGGTETGRVLALENILNQKQYDDKPNETALFVFCAILAVLKRDILGQDLDPVDIIRVMVNDYDDNRSKVNEAKEYVKKVYEMMYIDSPTWIK